MGLPARALDCQLELLRWLETDHGHRYANATVDVYKSYMRDHEKNDVEFVARSKRIDESGYVAHRVALDRGDTYAVTGEIVDVLEIAAPTLPPYTLHESDLPSEFGFVYLDRVIVVADGYGKPLVVKAIAWSRATTSVEVNRIEVRGDDDHRYDEKENGVVMLLFTDVTDPRDHLFEKSAEARTMLRERGMAAPGGLLSMVAGFWAFGDRPGDGLQRWLLTFFRFVQEPWTDTRSILPDRPAIRRARRAGRDEVQVRVVQLRRAAQPRHRPTDENGDEVLWSHRWLVRGHWRNQWYPSVQDHRPVWISGYVKGPEDRPLVVKDRVFHVER